MLNASSFVQLLGKDLILKLRKLLLFELSLFLSLGLLLVSLDALLLHLFKDFFLIKEILHLAEVNVALRDRLALSELDRLIKLRNGFIDLGLRLSLLDLQSLSVDVGQDVF